MSSYMLNDRLNRFFADEVQLSRDTSSRVVANVMPHIRELLHTIHDRDQHYRQNADAVGSYYQGLKVEKADEFDFNIPFNINTKLHWSSGSPLYFGFNDPSQNDADTMRDDLRVVSTNTPLQSPGTGYVPVQFSDQFQFRDLNDFMFRDYLIPFLVKRKLRKMLFDALNQDTRARDDMTLSRMVHGPALTMTVHVKDGTERIPVSIDFSVVIQAGLPFDAFIGWPRSDARWPSWEKIAMIKEKGINVVAKKNFHWLLSFAEVEKCLVKDIDKDGGCRKKVHRIMKTLWHKSGTKDKNVLSSYMLKNAWLWECERYPSSGSWSQVRLGERYLSCVHRLQEFLNRGCLPQYFYPQINLLKDKDVNLLQRTVNEIYAN